MKLTKAEEMNYNAAMSEITLAAQQRLFQTKKLQLEGFTVVKQETGEQIASWGFKK